MRTSDNTTIQELNRCRAVLAQEGILVSFEDEKRSHLHVWGTRYTAPNYNFPGSYFINTHGTAKLPLKPNRAPYQPHIVPRGKEEKIWWDFQIKIHQFISGVLGLIQA